MAKEVSKSSPLSQLEETLDLYFGQKAPALPASWKETLIKVAPWITLVVLIMTLPAVVAVLGIGTLFNSFSYLGGANTGFTYMLSLIFLAASFLLEAVALPGLFKRSKAGWKFVFYSTLVGMISYLVSFNLGGIILGTLLPLYILFQIKSYYK